MKKLLLFVAMLNSTAIYFAQTTVGLVYSQSGISEGYTLFTPERNNTVYLINNCGELVHQWEFYERPALTCYLLPNGNLLRAGQDSIQIRNWDNQLVWGISKTATGIHQNHDIEPLPNGNILCLANDIYTGPESVLAGRDPLLNTGEFRLNKIIEIQPVGTDQVAIVWEWKLMDHFIQEYDASKNNFGVVIEHPELVDINFDNQQPIDFCHMNSIDYNATLDQILVSARHLSEIYIIDHSTTTAQAAGHSGGTAGKGGDLIYRWGNPRVYQAGTATDQKLRMQHDAKWVDNGFPDAGNISVFNNGGDGVGTNSSVHLFAPVIMGSGYDTLNNRYLPVDFSWSWEGSVMGHLVQENNKSSVQSLENGNVIFCQTSIGQITELLPNGTIVWVYNNPSGTSIYSQYSTIASPDNSMFRAEKYPLTYAAFQGRDLAPLGLIEDQNSLSTSCQSTNGIENQIVFTFPFSNPITDQKIAFHGSQEFQHVRLFAQTGQLLLDYSEFSGHEIQVPFEAGSYILELTFQNSTVRYSIIL
jgi:hypothetical protein